MDARRRDNIRKEMKKAEDYLKAADILFKSELYTPSVTSSYYSAYHSSLAAFLTTGENADKDQHKNFLKTITKFSQKLDPFLAKFKEAKQVLNFNTSLDYSENEALLRLYQTREFFLEVKDFLRRLIK